MKVATLISWHERPFAAFGGVPRKVPYDKLKTVVIVRDMCLSHLGWEHINLTSDYVWRQKSDDGSCGHWIPQ